MDKNARSVVDAMTKFASDTKNDQLSVAVMRVAERFANQGSSFEKPLTAHERRIVKLFINQEVA